MDETAEIIDRYNQLIDLYKRYILPDSGISKDQFIGDVIEILDRPIGRGE